MKPSVSISAALGLFYAFLAYAWQAYQSAAASGQPVLWQPIVAAGLIGLVTTVAATELHLKLSQPQQLALQQLFVDALTNLAQAVADMRKSPPAPAPSPLVTPPRPSIVLPESVVRDLLANRPVAPSPVDAPETRHDAPTAPDVPPQPVSVPTVFTSPPDPNIAATATTSAGIANMASSPGPTIFQVPVSSVPDTIGSLPTVAPKIPPQ